MTDAQANAIIELLWDYMRKDKEHANRVRTGWGMKTKQGLVACIERIANDDQLKHGNR